MSAGFLHGLHAAPLHVDGAVAANQDGLVLRESRTRALAASGSGVWIADPEGHFIEPQPSWKAYTGQDWPQHREAGWLTAVHPDDREGLQIAWRQSRARSRPFEVEPRVWDAARQSYRRCVLRAAPVPGADGTTREWIGTLTDVEEQRIAEERKRLAERLETVGRLAGGVAHEANNQMTVVLAAADFLRRRLYDEAGRTDLEFIRKAAQRTATVAQDLLAFSRRQILQPRTISLNDLVSTVEPALRATLGETVQIVLRPGPGSILVNADPDQLHQVLLRLALNARDAMEQAGVLTIETADIAVGGSAAASDDWGPLAPGRYGMLVVSDTGRGMDEETLRHAFEPFFTTRGIGEGIGLGLAAVYGTVKQSGGFIRLESRPGKGAAFRIYLPAAEVAHGAKPAVPDHEIVLIAEDEELVRIMLARALRAAGYAVLEARDGVEAVEVATKSAVPPSLVIADLLMPKVSGQRLWNEFRGRWPELPLLFISGHTALDSISQGLIDSGHEFLQKPIEPDVLVRRVRDLLAARQR
jgi:two-component system, cell cycle sensor histidine kinase and response regulator CckA